MGGKREGAGRPKGSKNLTTQKLERKAKSGGLMPLEYMLKVMCNAKAGAERRDRMAIAAAPYITPRLQAVEYTAPPTPHIEERPDMLVFARQVALVLYLADKKLENEKDKVPKPK